MLFKKKQESHCRQSLAVFGVLVALIGLYGILKELGYFVSGVSFWSLLVFLVGLGFIAKAAHKH